MIKSTSAAFLLASLTISPIAASQEAPKPGMSFGMLRYDANQDGQITRDELQTALRAHFAARDTDGDGEITVAERQAARADRRAEAMSQRFERLDANSDGSLTVDEFSARPERDQAERGAQPPNRPAMGLGRGPGHQMTDVSYDQFAERRLAAFDQLDADSNNVVTQSELHAASGSMRGHGRQDR